MNSTTKSKSAPKTNGTDTTTSSDGSIVSSSSPVEVNTTDVGAMTGDQGVQATKRRRGESELVTVKLSRRTYVALKVIRDKRSIDFDQILANAVEEIADANGVPAHILKFFLEQEETTQ